MSQSTDHPSRNENSASDGLLHQFTNVETVFQAHVVAKPNGSVFHRIAPGSSADQLTPACHARPKASDWRATDPTRVRRSGLGPCRTCYEAIFEYLATDPDSPVEARTTSVHTREFGAELTDGDDLFEPLELPSISSLAVLTQEVLVRGGSSKVMHAPTEDGPLCGQAGEYRRAELEVFAGQYRPCEDCFAAATD